MGVIDKLLGAVATPTAAPIPAVNLIEARLTDPKRNVESCEKDYREATFQNEVAGTDEAASALAAARRDLDDARERVVSLQAALEVAQARAMTSADQLARVEHTGNARRWKPG
jgi:hypothetical protein